MEKGRAKKGNNERFCDFRAWLELERPEKEHPNGPYKELKRGKEPRERKDVQCLFVVDVEDNVLKVPEAKNNSKLKGLVRLRNLVDFSIWAGFLRGS